ncbi:MAG: hypothetical protein PHQ53_13040, partial [Candidatus Krumholzibacteria bacterium]|nr:hypothetical protein [Candidatus Krumholzibacteria bacterium]
MAKRKRSRERATPAPASPVAGSLAASRRWGWLLAPGIVCCSCSCSIENHCCKDSCSPAAT